MKLSSDYLLQNKRFLPKTKYYVYCLYLPDKTIPCYIGKGQGDRWRHYFYYPEKVSNRILRSKLVDIKSSNKTYFVEFLYETDDEQECLDVESFFITYFGRVYNKTGFLYNFDIESPFSAQERPSKRRAIYIDGFVFDSVSRAKDVTGIKSETIKNYCSVGRASYLDDEEQIQRVRERESKLKYHYFFRRHKKAFKRAKKIVLISESRMGDKNWMKGKATAISRKIKIDGTVYRSLNQAAKEFGYSKGDALRKFLERGNHNHQYEFMSD